MTILVTGGAGYIGSHMAWLLIDAGEDVCIIDNLSTGVESAIPGGAIFEKGDAGDIAFVRDVIQRHGIDAVMHFAGSIVVPDSVHDPLAYYRNNTCVSRNLIEACINGGVRNFIFSSSAAIYGDPERPLVDEATLPRPLSPYGTSKLMTELILRDAAAAYPIGYVALRYFNVAGADPQGRAGQNSPKATHLIKVACEAALGVRDHVDIFGTDYPTPDGTGVRDYIHVADLVEAHRLALKYLREGGRSLVLNCGYGRGYSVREVIGAVRAASCTTFAVRNSPRRPGDCAQIIADCGRIVEELNWRPRYDDIDRIVMDALSWEKRRLATAQVGLPQPVAAAEGALQLQLS